MPTPIDTSDKPNLKELEGIEEIFVDLLEDIGLFELTLGCKVNYGTYNNIFECVLCKDAAVETEAGLYTRRVKSHRAAFYDNPTQITIVTETDISSDDGTILDRRMYWFDSENNDFPSENSDWLTILENMDIFLDEL